MPTKASKTQRPGASLDWADRILEIVRSLQSDGRTVVQGFGGAAHHSFDPAPGVVIATEVLLPEIMVGRNTGVALHVIQDEILPRACRNGFVDETHNYRLDPDTDYGAYVTLGGHVVQVSPDPNGEGLVVHASNDAGTRHFYVGRQHVEAGHRGVRSYRLAIDADPPADPQDPHAPYARAEWFDDEFGLSAGALRGRARRGHIKMTKGGGRNLYSVPDAMNVWPDQVTYGPS